MRWISFLLLLTVLSSCSKSVAAEDNLEVETILDVAYGSDPLQKMDIYLPANRSANSTKVLVLIHGGGWSQGDKADFTGLVPQLQERLPDYAIFNINYRLAGNGQLLFPTQENDVSAAIAFIHTQQSNYGIGQQYVYLGGSAGAHLALLQAYKHPTPIRPSAVISFFGPTNLVALYQSNVTAADILLQATGATPQSNSSIYLQSSPSSFVDAGSPPTLLLHGGADQLVPPSQANLLKTLLDGAAVPNEYVFYPLEGHGWAGTNLVDSFDKLTAFLRKHID